MQKIQIIKQLLIEAGFKVTENARSLVTTCLSCNKPKHLYLFLETGYGRCLKCNTFYTPESIIVELKQCSYAEAREILGSGQMIPKAEYREKPLQILKPESEQGSPKEAIKDITMPFNFFKLSERLDFTAAWEYLLKRGVLADIVQIYDLRYCPDMKRIIIPIYMNGKCAGWQGRDITGQSELPYMSPAGFSRARILMGYDHIDSKYNYVVLGEGPFDLLKLAVLRNAVCSMGKVVTSDQLNLIRQLPVKRVYIALDPDACDLFDKIAFNLMADKEVYLMIPPDDKKDFGDCSSNEILKAFLQAKPYSRIGFWSGKLIKT
jgi:hypothetical protein